MIIQSGTYVSFESSAAYEPRQRISNIYIYLYVSDLSVFIGSEGKVISMLSSDMSYTAKGVEPDQLASEKPADQDPHCFLRYL